MLLVLGAHLTLMLLLQLGQFLIQLILAYKLSLNFEDLTFHRLSFCLKLLQQVQGLTRELVSLRNLTLIILLQRVDL